MSQNSVLFDLVSISFPPSGVNLYISPENLVILRQKLGLDDSRAMSLGSEAPPVRLSLVEAVPFYQDTKSPEGPSNYNYNYLSFIFNVTTGKGAASSGERTLTPQKTNTTGLLRASFEVTQHPSTRHIPHFGQTPATVRTFSDEGGQPCIAVNVPRDSLNPVITRTRKGPPTEDTTGRCSRPGDQGKSQVYQLLGASDNAVGKALKDKLATHAALTSQALVLMSVGGVELTFEVPMGEAFELGVQLTSKGYRRGA